MNDKMVKVKVKGNGKVKATAKVITLSVDHQPDDFELFWSAYPRKIGKKAARKAWDKAKDKPEVVDLIQAIEKAKKSTQWQKENGQFIPYPSTWINQGRWHDEFLPATTPDPNGFLASMKAFIERG